MYTGNSRVVETCWHVVDSFLTALFGCGHCYVHTKVK